MLTLLELSTQTKLAHISCGVQNQSCFCSSPIHSYFIPLEGFKPNVWFATRKGYPIPHVGLKPNPSFGVLHSNQLVHAGGFSFLQFCLVTSTTAFVCSALDSVFLPDPTIYIKVAFRPLIGYIVSQRLPKSSTAISLNPFPRLRTPMALSIAIAELRSVFGWSKPEWKAAAAMPEVELKRRNEELEREIRSGQEREDGLTRELERVKVWLMVAEEAEEWLCVQLGELEAEAAEQDREYQQGIRKLTRELAQAKSIVNSSPSVSSEN